MIEVEIPKRGEWVRVEPTRGKRNHSGRIGRLVAVNDGEYGVLYTEDEEEVVCWFRPSELVTIRKPRDAPRILLKRGRQP